MLKLLKKYWVKYYNHFHKKRISPNPEQKPIYLPNNFCEESYLLLNQDVALAVKKGEFETGRDHYLLHGYKESRRTYHKLSPD